MSKSVYKELEIWQFIASRLESGEAVMLLVVAASSGSSPGRAGYKMAVGADGELSGSIGGGVMEVALADAAKLRIENEELKSPTELVEQVHQKNSPDSSGMICSGRQTVLSRMLTTVDAGAVHSVISSIEHRQPTSLTITRDGFHAGPTEVGSQNGAIEFDRVGEDELNYRENIGQKNELYIIGGGHCALALSEVMSKLGFRIAIFDDRPELNTLEKNTFANDITIIDDYENIGGHIPGGDTVYVVVMTLGYKFDEIVIRELFDREFKYFGVLGSKAKMKTLLSALENDGFDQSRLSRIRTPIGLSINSRTPEEIAISIAAEMISVKNTDQDAKILV